MRWKVFIVGALLGSLAFQSLPGIADQRDALSVGFLSQMDGSQFAQTNCGPASVAMAINYATGQKLTPLAVREAIARLPGGAYARNPASGTAVGDLARIAREHSVEVFPGDGPSSVGWGPERIRKHLEQGHPVIVLTRLAHLPGYSSASQVDHYILVIGATATGFVYNDPGQSAGARRTISQAQLQLAKRSSGVPGQGVAFGGPSGSKPTVASSDPQPDDPPTLKYTVVRGDTVSQLARTHGVSQQQFVALNRGIVRNVNHIEVGQILNVPAPPTPMATPPTAPPPIATPPTAPPPIATAPTPPPRLTRAVSRES
jgi:LysM repeat protein